MAAERTPAPGFVYPLVVYHPEELRGRPVDNYAVHAIYSSKDAALEALRSWTTDGDTSPVYCYVTRVALDDPDVLVYSMEGSLELRSWNVAGEQAGGLVEPLAFG